jgi:pilus assembly protein CpaF
VAIGGGCYGPRACCSVDAVEQLAVSLRERLVERVREDPSALPVDEQVRALVAVEAAPLPEAERERLAERVLRLATGLGPLDPLLADAAVDEVMVNGGGEVYVERDGRVEPAGARFDDTGELMHAVERILAPLGRRVDEASPLCDARLPDGSRVNVVIPPLAVDGPCLTIRRFRRGGFSLADLVENSTMPQPLADYLAGAVERRATILVSGGTGCGKTTTLGALSGAIPASERIVTIEDAAELRLRQPHVVRLEARPPNVEGTGEVTIRQLVRNALRMRPDRIVVGEVRGAEALDMLMALNTGHEGSLSTVHANSAEEALRRVEVLALMAGVGLPHAAVRAQVADAFDLVVHQARRAGGERRVTSVAEVVRVAGGAGTRELFALRGNRPVWRLPAAP